MRDMNTSDESGRIRTADVLKGAMILGIVFVHLFMLNAVDDTERTASLLAQVVYMGLVGFFFISGYFHRPGSSLRENLIKRSKLLVALLICSLVLPILLYIWLWVLGQPATVDDLWISIVASLGNQNDFMPLDAPDPIKVCYSAYTHYFLWVMLVSFIIFYAIADRVVSDRRLFAVTLVLLLAAQAILCYWNMKLPFFSTLVPIAAAFMLAGRYLSGYQVLERLDTGNWRNPRYWAPLAVCIPLLVALICLFPPGVRFNFLYLGEYGGLSAFPYFAEGLLVFIIFSYVAAIVSKIPVLSNVLELCGKHSLALALLHIFFVRLILALFFILPTDEVFPPVPLWQMAVLGIIDVALILILCHLAARWSQKRKTKGILASCGRSE